MPKIEIRLDLMSPRILGITKQLNTNHYLILLSPLQTREQLELTLLHELVHVKQFTRRLLFKKGELTYWKGQVIDWNQAYSKRPWEQQAFKESEAYLTKFKTR